MKKFLTPMMALAAASAFAQLPLVTSFEAPTYDSAFAGAVTGSLIGQDGWLGSATTEAPFYTIDSTYANPLAGTQVVAWNSSNASTATTNWAQKATQPIDGNLDYYKWTNDNPLIVAQIWVRTTPDINATKQTRSGLDLYGQTVNPAIARIGLARTVVDPVQPFRFAAAGGYPTAAGFIWSYTTAPVTDQWVLVEVVADMQNMKWWPFAYYPTENAYYVFTVDALTNATYHDVNPNITSIYSNMLYSFKSVAAAGGGHQTYMDGYAIDATYYMQGQVDLADFTGDKTGLTFEVEIRDPANGDAVVDAWKPVTLDVDGKFRMNTVARGTYDLYIRGPHWLTKKVAAVDFGYGYELDLDYDTVTTGVQAVPMTNGNAENADNVVDLGDYLRLSAAFDSMLDEDPETAGNQSSATWDANCDLNGDGVVDLTDYLILSGNFDLSGD